MILDPFHPDIPRVQGRRDTKAVHVLPKTAPLGPAKPHLFILLATSFHPSPPIHPSPFFFFSPCIALGAPVGIVHRGLLGHDLKLYRPLLSLQSGQPGAFFVHPFFWIIPAAIMADTATSTGAQYDADLRRRNVPDAGRSQAPASSGAEDDVKKAKPQVRNCFLILNLSIANEYL